MLLSEFNILAMASSRHVNIVNSLEGNLDLTIHCKSKDDDLGVHLLHHGDSFGWKFHNSFFGETLFFCSFQWNNEFHYFDIYIAGRDTYRCFICDWSVVKSGPCLNLPNKSLCYTWNKSLLM
jgi:hypothetical protein